MDEEDLEYMSAMEELERRKRLHEAEQGLTKRQIVALEIYIATINEKPQDDKEERKKVLRGCYRWADEFLEAGND